MKELQVPIAQIAATTRLGAVESLIKAMLLPILAFRAFLTIAGPTLVALLALGIAAPGSSIMGLRAQQVWIGFITPFLVLINGDVVGIVVWAGSALLLSASLTAWSLKVSAPGLSLATCWQTGWRRALHYLLASCLVPTFGIPILLTVASLPLHRLIGLQVAFNWSLPLSPTPGLWISAMVGLVVMWLLLRLLPLPTVVALRGWRNAVPTTWRSTRGLVWRFAMALVVMAIIMGVVGQATAAGANAILHLASPALLPVLSITIMSTLGVLLSLTLSFWICGLIALQIPLEYSAREHPTLDVF